MAGSNFTATIEACNLSAPVVNIKPTTQKQAIETNTSFTSLRVHPNPFSAVTQIQFQLAEEAVTSIAVFDQNGQKISQLMPPTTLTPGTHQIDFTNKNSYHGLLFVVLQVGSETMVQKVIVME
jgi:hypothetical protein